jgi:hypothetical protein
LDKWLFKLGAKRVRAVGAGDDAEDLFAQLDGYVFS